MTKTVKIVLIILLSLITFIVVGTYAYISTQLDTKELRISIKDKIEKTFPQMKANIGEIKVEFGQSLELSSDKLELVSISESPLFKVDHFTLKVPLLSILLGGGNVELDIFSPKVFVEIEKDKSNWEEAIEGNKAKTLFTFEKTTDFVIPAFLANSTLAIRLNHLDIAYRNIGKEKFERNTSVSKFVVKNLGINSNAAYELKSNFSVPMLNGEILEFHSFIVGSINLSEYLETQKLPINSTYKFDDIKVKGHGEILPLVSGNFEVVIDEKKTLMGSHNLRFEKTSLKHKVSINKNEIKLYEIKGASQLYDFNRVFNVLSLPIKISQGDIDLSGDLSINEKSYKPNVELKAPQISGTLSGSEFNVKANAIFSEKKITLEKEGQVYGGSLFFKSVLDYEFEGDYQKSKNLGDLIKSIETKIQAKDLNLSSKEISDLTQMRLSEIKTFKKWPILFILPNSHTQLEVTESKLDGSPLKISIETKTNQVESNIKEFKVQYGEGTTEVLGGARFYQNGINSNWKIKFTNFPASFFNALRDENKAFIEGDINGLIYGPYSIREAHEIYDFKIDLTSKKGRVVGVDLNEEVEKVKSEIKDLPFVGNKIKWRNKTVSNGYRIMSLDATLINKELNLKKMKFEEEEGLLKMNAKGRVYLDSQRESLITANVEDDLGFIDYVSKELGIKTVPIALKGMGTKLSLDRDYTTNKFIEHFQGSKGKEKVKTLIDENVDKIMKGENGKQLKKLLKGFLK